MNNKLTPIKKIGNSTNKSKTSIWLFKCDCGNETVGTLSSYNRGSKSSCGCALKEHLKRVHSKNTISDAVRQNIIDDYKTSNVTRKVLAAKYNISHFTVTKILKESNIDINFRRDRKIYFENNFNLYNKNSLYWIGFIAADGHISRNGHLAIGISEKDITHLEKFKQFMCGNEELKIRRNIKTKSVHISINSNEIVRFFRDLRMQHNKSLNLTIDPRLSNSPDFWRGMIDGDGWIQVNKRGELSVGLCGTFDTVNSFKQWCSQHIRTTAKIRRNNSDTCFSYVISCKKAEFILNLLYNDSVIFLQRKHDKYKEYLEQKYG